MDVSVVICTRNRSESLGKTLEGLLEITVPTGCSWEVVVIDNCSTDSTHDVVEAFRNTTGLPVTYVYEPAAGLSNARNRGIRESIGAVIAFTDDDIIVDRYWLREIVKEAVPKDSPAMIFGQTRRYAKDTPWLSIKEDESRQRFAFPASPWSMGHGNNMILHRDLIAAVGNFDPDLGAGSRVGAAEDTDYVYRVLKSGREILYEPSIIVYHNHGRISEEATRRVNLSYAKGRGAFYCKHLLRGDIWVARLLYRELRNLFRMVFESGEKRKKAIFNMKGLSYGILRRAVLELMNAPVGLVRKVPTLFRRPSPGGL